MDILTIVLACSLHFDDQLVTALVHKVSNDNPLLVGDLVTLTTHDHLTSVEAARAVVDDIIKHGGRPAVGLLGVPIAWAARYGRTPDELFDSCTNIAVGTAALSEYARQCTPHRSRETTPGKPRTPSRRTLDRQRACILEQLGDALGASGYVTAVLAEIASRRERQADVSTDPPAATSAIDVPLDGTHIFAHTPLVSTHPDAPPSISSAPMPAAPPNRAPPPASPPTARLPSPPSAR